MHDKGLANSRNQYSVMSGTKTAAISLWGPVASLYYPDLYSTVCIQSLSRIIANSAAREISAKLQKRMNCYSEESKCTTPNSISGSTAKLNCLDADSYCEVKRDSK